MLFLTHPDYLNFVSVYTFKPDNVPNISEVFSVAWSELVVSCDLSFLMRAVLLLLSTILYDL